MQSMLKKGKVAGGQWAGLLKTGLLAKPLNVDEWMLSAKPLLSATGHLLQRNFQA